MLPKLVKVQNCSKLQMDYKGVEYPCYKSNQVSIGDLSTLAKCVQSANMYERRSDIINILFLCKFGV
jgi:hypothetical protein